MQSVSIQFDSIEAHVSHIHMHRQKNHATSPPYHSTENRAKSGQVNLSHVNYANLFAKWKWLAIEFAVDGHA